MVPNIIVFDGAVDDFDHVLKYAETAVFEDVTSPVDGRVYPDVHVLGEKERDAFTILATSRTGLPLRCNLAAIRKNHPVKTTTEGLIHADVGHGDFASVFYLYDSPPGYGDGTAFWRHLRDDVEFNPNTTHIPDELLPDLDNPQKWDMTGFVGARANRFLVYPTVRYHSRWPAQGWALGEKCRTVIVAFYDLVSNESAPSHTV